MTEKYDNGNCAKWYYNTSNNITDGENEYTVHRKEPVTYLDGEILHGTNDLLDRLNEYECEVEQLKKDYDSLSHNHGLLYDESVEKIGALKEQLIDCEQKKQAHKEMLMNSTAVVEQKKLQKIIYGMVIATIDERIKAYEHPPFSAPVSNPANPNYDPDVDRLARLSELQELRKEFEL